MTDRDPAPPSPSPPSPVAPLPRRGLFVACLLHALPLGWAAWVLPMHGGSWFALVIGLLAVLHGAVAVLALGRHERALRATWLALSIYSLLLLFGVSVVVASAAAYLVGLYQGIGIAVSAALAGIWGLLVLLTVPVAAWGLARTLPARARTLRPALIGGAGLVLFVVTGLTLVGSAARAASVPAADDTAVAQAIVEATQRSSRGAAPVPGSLLWTAPLPCAVPVQRAALTLLVVGAGHDLRPFGSCLQAPDGPTLVQSLTRLLAQRQRPGTPLKLDLVRAVARMVRVNPLFDALSLRPALDGVCTGKACFAPWQLVPLSAFTRYRPLEAVRDASFGAAVDELAAQLGSTTPGSEPLFRIETRSWLVHHGRAEPYVRTRPAHVPSDAAAHTQAVAAAGRHIIAAQRPDGGFRYLLDPFTGVVQERLNLPRQAGTTLALCELVSAAQARGAVERALGQLQTFEQRSGALSAISESNTMAELGPSALPLATFASCRRVVGDRHDALIGRLARLLMTMQRSDGSFHPQLDLRTGEAVGSSEPLYAGGQAVLALVLVEQLATSAPSPYWPAREALHDAVERAQRFYAQDYWPRALRSLFYIEENWHCLAARAALPVHRRTDYEDFCLDYVRFKSRLILQADDGVSVEHAGGYGLSDMFPPHSTATAGFGEAMAAALAVKHARGMRLQTDQTLLRQALSFVLRQQWTADNCYACANGLEAVGAFSESESSPSIRIDYVQHAMAALGHGSTALQLRTPADEGP